MKQIVLNAVKGNGEKKSTIASRIKDALSTTSGSEYSAQSPLRKALSPINANQKPFEVKATPTAFVASCSTNNGVQNNGTPLGKLSTRSSTLKVQLAF